MGITMFMDHGVTRNCINSASYGEICVGCNACGRYDEETRRECAMALYQCELHEQFAFDNWLEGWEDIQKTNQALNIEFLERKITELIVGEV